MKCMPKVQLMEFKPIVLDTPVWRSVGAKYGRVDLIQRRANAACKRARYVILQCRHKEQLNRPELTMMYAPRYGRA
jgi:hypothetical protein